MDAVKLLTGPNQPYRCPSSLKGTPHTCVRDRAFYTLTDNSAITTTTAGTGEGLALMGCWGAVDGQVIDPVYGFLQGTRTSGGARAVFADDTKFYSNQLTGSDLARVRMASLHVRIQATTPASGFFPTGFLYVGSLSQNIDANSFPNATALADHIKGRHGVRVWTAAQAMSGIDVVLCPNDMITNQQLVLLGTNPASGTAMFPNDGWGTIGIVGTGSVTNPVSYLITAHVRWSVEFTRDLFKQSTHALHPAVSDSSWGMAKGLLHDAGGIVSEIAGGAVKEAASIMGARMGRMGARAVGAAAPAEMIARPPRGPPLGPVGVAAPARAPKRARRQRRGPPRAAPKPKSAPRKRW